MVRRLRPHRLRPRRQQNCQAVSKRRRSGRRLRFEQQQQQQRRARRVPQQDGEPGLLAHGGRPTNGREGGAHRRRHRHHQAPRLGQVRLEGGERVRRVHVLHSGRDADAAERTARAQAQLRALQVGEAARWQVRARHQDGLDKAEREATAGREGRGRMGAGLLRHMGRRERRGQQAQAHAPLAGAQVSAARPRRVVQSAARVLVRRGRVGQVAGPGGGGPARQLCAQEVHVAARGACLRRLHQGALQPLPRHVPVSAPAQDARPGRRARPHTQAAEAARPPALSQHALHCLHRTQGDRARHRRASERPVALVRRRRQDGQVLGGGHRTLHEHVATRGQVCLVQLAASRLSLPLLCRHVKTKQNKTKNKHLRCSFLNFQF